MRHMIEGPCLGSAALCEPILRSLPDWFGIEVAIVQYVAEIDHLPTFLARDGDQVSGFLSLKQHNPYSAEVFVMGVRQEMHRRGTGRALIGRAEEWLKSQGLEFVQVKRTSYAPIEPLPRLGTQHATGRLHKPREFGLPWSDWRGARRHVPLPSAGGLSAVSTT